MIWLSFSIIFSGLTLRCWSVLLRLLLCLCLNILKIMIEVRVYPTMADYGKGDFVLVRRIDYEGIKVPFESILETFRALYGSTCVVDFVCTV